MKNQTFTQRQEEQRVLMQEILDLLNLPGEINNELKKETHINLLIHKISQLPDSEQLNEALEKEAINITELIESKELSARLFIEMAFKKMSNDSLANIIKNDPEKIIDTIQRLDGYKLS
ncbi:hypothetical protein OAP56_04875, partial [Rickettsiaceae bacterium]|nr:hypothetical protein [Rickettsiaceae bacterium]